MRDRPMSGQHKANKRRLINATWRRSGLGGFRQWLSAYPIGLFLILPAHVAVHLRHTTHHTRSSPPCPSLSSLSALQPRGSGGSLAPSLRPSRRRVVLLSCTPQSSSHVLDPAASQCPWPLEPSLSQPKDTCHEPENWIE